MATFWKKGMKDGEKEMSFLEHLEELRWHIIRSILAIFILMIVAFIFKEFIFGTIIMGPRKPDFITARLLCQLGEFLSTLLNKSLSLCINQSDFQLINIKMSGQLTVHITSALVSGVILGVPVILWEFWRFFKPALKDNEAKYATGAVTVSSLLFFTGVCFGYFLLAPLSIHFLSNYEIDPSVANQINVRSYIGTLTSICLATGLVFELPIVAFFLTKIGVITPEFMKRYRRHSIIVIFILSAIITPPDVFSQTLVAVPLLILYEISIHISKRVVRQKEKEHDEFMKDN